MEDFIGVRIIDCLNKLKSMKYSFPAEVSIYIISQICKGLHFAHSFKSNNNSKILHLDVNPHNIIFNYIGAIKIYGFGEARLTAKSSDSGIRGMLSYLSPEYLDGLSLDEIDERYDQFTLAIVLWEMLCSRKLFKAENDLAILKLIHECNIPLPSSINPNVSNEVDSIVLRALSKDRSKRFDSLEQMSIALDNFLKSKYADFNPADTSYIINSLFADNFNNNPNLIERVFAHPTLEKFKGHYGGTALHTLANQSHYSESLIMHPMIDKHKDNYGSTPLHNLANITDSTIVAEKILKHPSVDKVKNQAGDTPLSYLKKSENSTIAQMASSFLPTISREEIHDEVALSLRGLVGVEDFIKNFSFELESFREQKTKSRGIVLWGSSSVGKTEIAKRICGIGGNKGQVEISGLNFKYIACCDESISPKDIVASSENGTVLFLDEVDKYLSQNSGISNESQVKGLRSSLITNFNSKAIFWVFTGTFSDIRGNNNLSLELLSMALGSELSSRIDFVGWKLKDWTLSSLMKAATFSSLSKDENIEYAEDALLLLCEYVLKHGGGVRSLERSHESIKRMNQDLLSKKDSKVFFTKDSVLNLIRLQSGEVA